MSDSYRFGNVQGPVNVGNPVNHSGNQVVGSGHISISGGNQNQFGPDQEVLAAVESLRAQLDELRLTGSERTAAAEDLARLERAEDKPAAATALESFLDRLKRAGALARAGAEITEPVGKILRWLGPLAAGALALL